MARIKLDSKGRRSWSQVAARVGGGKKAVEHEANEALYKLEREAEKNGITVKALLEHFEVEDHEARFLALVLARMAWE